MPLWIFESGCSESHVMDDGGLDSPSALVEVGSDALDGADAGLEDGGTAPVICAGRECASGQECCFVTGSCVDPRGDTCALVADGGILDAGRGACVANSDCLANEFCYSERDLCLGPGVCVARDGRVPCDRQVRCGCDGRDYEGICEADRAGVRVVPPSGGCGEVSSGEPRHPVLCGSDADCDGSACCPVTGFCLPPDCPDCCFDPRERGGQVPCLSDAYCHALLDRDLSSEHFCYAPSCTGPGVCARRSGTCDSGVLEPVCGCDGRTYTNEGCARSAGARVASFTACGEPSP